MVNNQRPPTEKYGKQVKPPILRTRCSAIEIDILSHTGRYGLAECHWWCYGRTGCVQYLDIGTTITTKLYASEFSLPHFGQNILALSSFDNLSFCDSAPHRQTEIMSLFLSVQLLDGRNAEIVPVLRPKFVTTIKARYVAIKLLDAPVIRSFL
jgi:hypothetical protein